MGRKFSATFVGVSVSAVQDLFMLLAPSDGVVIIHSVVITQESDAQDAEDEMLRIKFHRASTTGSGGTSANRNPLDPGDSACNTTVDVNDTTQGTEGAILLSEAFNIRAGFYHIPPPEDRIVIPASSRLCIELEKAPADALTMSGTVIFEEIG